MKDAFSYNKKNGYCTNILLTTKSESVQKKHKKTKIIKKSAMNSSKARYI